MKFCPKCGTAVSDDVIFCPQCGCGIDLANNRGISGFGRYNNGYGGGQVERIHSVLSALMPIYGLAYWFFKRQEDPEKAASCLRIAGISMIVYFLIYFAMFFLMI